MIPKNENRRKFLLHSAQSAAGLMMVPLVGQAATDLSPKKIAEPKTVSPYVAPRIKFAVIGMNHGHIYGQVNAVERGGGELVAYYAKEKELMDDFKKRFPKVKAAASEQEILDDKSIQLVLSAGIPQDRAPLGIRVMKSGKDYMSDKPGITSLAQLVEVRKVQKATKQIYSIMYSERFENKATVKAGELVKAGAIGKVVQTIGLGPHRMNPKSRPDWFFKMSDYGGIITDIGSHQFDQFLFFTGSTEAHVVASEVGNVGHPQYPDLQDFGDVMVRGNGGMGYVRVDWFTPDGLKSWGDGRLTILGTEGFIEIRKNVDISGAPGGNHLFLVDNKETKTIDTSDVDLPYGRQLVDDVINRTETAMTQAHCFLTMELALKAQAEAERIKLS